MTRFALVVVFLGLAGAAQADPSVAIPTPDTPDQAATPIPPLPGAADNGRFSFHRSGDTFIRLDSRTGELSECGWSAGVWSCKLVPDERAALESEIARLQRENAALKKSLLARGVDPPGVVAEAPAARTDRPVPPAEVPDASPQPPKMPSEADLDRAIAYMKNVWRKFVDMMLDLQRDVQRRS